MRFVFALACAVLSLSAFSPGLARAGFDEGVAAYEREDYARALAELLPLARGGNAYAQTYVAVIYHYGLGVNADLGTAVSWYARAAEAGDSLAQRILGDLHYEGAWDKVDYAAAAQWYQIAAKGGDVDAQRKLGAMYLDGLGVPVDHNAAARWLSEAASQDDAQARALLRDSRVDRSRPRARPGPDGNGALALRMPSKCAGGFPNADYDINVKTIFPQPRINHSLSIAQLGKLSGLGHNTRTLGLMKPDLIIETRPRAQGLKVGDKFCFWITGFDVNLRYRRVDVFVAKEYPVGSCPYRAILAHEREHVRVSKRNLEEYAPRIRQALTSLLIPTGRDPALVASAAEARVNVEGISKELLQPLYKEMLNSLMVAQQTVDSPHEYARVRRQCSNW